MEKFEKTITGKDAKVQGAEESIPKMNSLITHLMKLLYSIDYNGSGYQMIYTGKWMLIMTQDINQL